MTLHQGYALAADEALEELDMGGGSRLSLRVTGSQSSGRVTVIRGEVLAGGPPLHVHDAEDEVVVVLEGSLEYQLGDDRGRVDAGGLLWFPRTVPHAIANNGEAPVRFITIVTPSGIEEFFRAQRDYLTGLAPGVPPDPAVMASLPGADRRQVVGPPLTPLPR